MKNLFPPLLVLVLAACTSTGNKESSSQDSTVVSSDTSITVVPDTAITVDAALIAEAFKVEDTTELGKLFEEISGDITGKQEQYYTVTVSISQYEGGSDVTWYFDKDISPVYYSETWAMEGNEGTTEYFITGGKAVLCAHSQSSYSEDKWCSSMGGTRTSTEGAEPVSSPLPDDYGNNQNVYLERALQNLIQLMNQCDITEKDETDYTLRMEQTVDVGQEVTETAEIHISRAVYKELMGE